jgi:hypothetical protein
LNYLRCFSIRIVSGLDIDLALIINVEEPLASPGKTVNSKDDSVGDGLLGSFEVGAE